MSKLLERLRSKKDDNRNRGNRKGEGPKPMHSKKKQKEFEKEQGKKELERFHETGDPNPQEPILKKGYIDQTSMHSAVQRWNSSTPLMQRDATGVGSKTEGGFSYKTSVGDKKGKKAKKALKQEQSKRDAETADTLGLTTEEVERTGKGKKQKLTDEQKAERRDKIKGVAYDIGRAMQAYAGWDVAGERGEESEKKKKTKKKDTKTSNTPKGETDKGVEPVISIGSTDDKDKDKNEKTGILGEGIVSTTSPNKKKGEPKKKQPKPPSNPYKLNKPIKPKPKG